MGWLRYIVGRLCETAPKYLSVRRLTQTPYNCARRKVAAVHRTAMGAVLVQGMAIEVNRRYQNGT
jgi:hypothetical protein